MSINKQQRVAMAVIVLVGLAGGGAVLVSGHAAEGRASTEHADDSRHDDNAGSAAKKPAVDGDKAEAHEERAVKLDAQQLQTAGITIQAAGPATLQASARFQGEIRADEDRTAHVVPRLAGIAEAVRANLGQVVTKGQVLAVIASTSLSDQRSEWLTAQKRRELAKSTYEREQKLWLDRISAEQDFLAAKSALQEADIAVQNATQKLEALGAGMGRGSAGLNQLEIRAPFAGTVVAKHLSVGEAVKEDATIFTISDLRGVWAEFVVAPQDLNTVRVGQKVVVSSTALEGQAEGTVSYVGALLGEQTRTAPARVTLANPQGAWRPGLYVTVAVRGENRAVAIAVNADALQTIEAQPMLFIATATGFVARPVKVGRNDGKTAEILSGIQAGERYAASKTFVLKSELGKADADHGH